MGSLTGCVSVQLSVLRKMHGEMPPLHPSTNRDTHTCTCAQHRHVTPFYLWPLWCWREFKVALSPPPLPSPPQAAPPLRKYSSGVPRATQEMLCVLRVSQAIFCPRTGRRLGREQPGLTYSAVLTLSVVPSTAGSGCHWVSQCLS